MKNWFWEFSLKKEENSWLLNLYLRLSNAFLLSRISLSGIPWKIYLTWYDMPMRCNKCSIWLCSIILPSSFLVNKWKLHCFGLLRNASCRKGSFAHRVKHHPWIVHSWKLLLPFHVQALINFVLGKWFCNFSVTKFIMKIRCISD